MRDPSWQKLFPGEEFRWNLTLRTGDPAASFAPTPQRGEKILGQRRNLLAEAASFYAVLPAGESDLIGESLAAFSLWTGNPFAAPLAAATSLEPDWVLLRPGDAGGFRVAAGVVCFPSHWSLPEKIGKAVEEVHGPVPGLNATLGRSIATFLEKLPPGTSRERDNWGLAADPELDHHPRRGRARLTGSESLDRIWLRVERQLFARLPGGGLVFAIRVEPHRLDRLASLPGLAVGIVRALRSLPEEVAVYKGIAAARNAIADRLEGGAAGSEPAGG